MTTIFNSRICVLFKNIILHFWPVLVFESVCLSNSEVNGEFAVKKLKKIRTR